MHFNGKPIQFLGNAQELKVKEIKEIIMLSKKEKKGFRFYTI